MWVRIAAGTAVLVACLSGCGDQPTGARPAADASALVPADASAPTADPTLPGVAANDDLVDFTCARDARGQWNARGTIVNPATTSDYRITVVVAPTGVERPLARRQVLPSVRHKRPTGFNIARIPVTTGYAPSCRVQVVRFR